MPPRPDRVLRPALRCASPLLLLLLGAAAPPSGNTVAGAPDEVVVAAPKNAKLVASYPADGATVAGGTAVLKLVFDQPMTPEAWSYSPVPGAAFPACLNRPRLLPDRKTFVLLCTLALNSEFAMTVNGAPDFVSTAGKAPPPVTLRFKTGEDETVSLNDALKNAGLSDADDPIMSEEPSKGPVIARPKPAPETNAPPPGV